MNLFRKGIFWILPIMIGMFLGVFGIKQFQNGLAANIVQMYSLIIRDVVVLGLVLPAMSLLVLKEINEFMVCRRILAIQDRHEWWEAVCRRVFINCIGLAAVILLPAFLSARICMGEGREFWEWGYVISLLLTFFLYLCVSSLCMVLLEMKIRQNILSVCAVLIASFLPNIVSFLFRESGIPDIGGLLSLAYALDEDVFSVGMEEVQGIYWFRCVGVCAVFFVLLLVFVRVGKVLIKRQDIFWK